uniref:Uncharacterized protein n=1 Tax=Rhizophora mucronata TaxID=61149 RepID=A0A2P2NTG1_RHIMU
MDNKWRSDSFQFIIGNNLMVMGIATAMYMTTLLMIKLAEHRAIIKSHVKIPFPCLECNLNI